QKKSLQAKSLQYALLAATLGAAIAVAGPQITSRSFSSITPPSEYRARRNALSQKLGSGVVVLFGTTEGPGAEAYRDFHQESNFYYLTGYTGPNAILLLAAGKPEDEILFLPTRHPDEEVWTGPEPDPEDPALAARLGVSKVRDASTLEAELHRRSE